MRSNKKKTGESESIRCKKMTCLFFRRLFSFCAFFFLFFLLFSCLSCRSVPGAAVSSEDEFFSHETEHSCWEHISNGIDFFVYKDNRSRLMYEIVRIDLRNPCLSIFTMKSTADWQKTTTVKSFAKRTGADVAINTSPFFMKNRIVPWSKGRPCGLVISDGEMLVPADGRYCAIAFYRVPGGGWTAKIFDRQTDVLSDGLMPDEAAGGFWTILRGGSIIPFADIKDTRSAAALSADGRMLYLLAGKNLTYGECAALLKKHGADSAMQFDGGSSTQLVVRGENTVFQNIPRTVCAIIGFSVSEGAD